MASFSFGAGNALKLAAIPLYAAGRIATLFVPRSQDQWVFGCGAGIGDGALALWDVVSAEGHDAVWLVGSERERSDAAERGIPTLPKHSLRGLWRTARARVIVVTHGFGDVNRYVVSGAFVVQLWHGIPLKRIGLDSRETLRLPSALERGMPGARAARRMLAAMYRGAARRIRVLPAASHLVRGRLESAFALPDERVPVTGEPRVDVLSQGTADERRTVARGQVERVVHPIDAGARWVLYAPTWRDGAVDPAIPSPHDWRALVDALDAADATLLVRSHPLGAGDYAPPFPTDRVRRIGSDLVPDITPLLPAFDALITDYSSLVFDSALVPLPVVFLAPDLDDYAARRGFYGTYADVAGADEAVDWTGAVAQLAELLGSADERERRVERALALSRRVHAHRDGGNTRRVYRAILAGLDADARRSKGPR